MPAWPAIPSCADYVQGRFPVGLVVELWWHPADVGWPPPVGIITRIEDRAGKTIFWVALGGYRNTQQIGALAQHIRYILGWSDPRGWV